MTQPNFFILGAPKCGTTSLALWLRAHPNVFMSRPKEPNYFAEDFELAWRWDLARYENLFRGAGVGHRRVGEASTMYLRSRVAIRDILRYAPRAKFIVGIRNPVNMVISLHRQRVNEAMEPEKRVEAAWRLQQSRRRGEALPERCRDAKLLMYADFCRLGEQLEWLLARVPRDQVFIYTLDELRRDPRTLWMELLAFLELPDDGRSRFPVANAARNAPGWINLTVRLMNAAKMKAGVHGRGLGVLSALQRRLSNTHHRDVPPRFRQELARYFYPDIATLEKITGRDLSAWGPPPSLPPPRGNLRPMARAGVD